MKLLPVLICIFLFGLSYGQEGLQKSKTLDGLENKLPTAIKTDTSFLEFKRLYLYNRDYSGITPTSKEVDDYMDCIKAHAMADSINFFKQMNTKPKFVGFMLSFSDSIPAIVKDCNLDAEMARDFLRPIIQMQTRLLDLAFRYPEVAADPNPWATLLTEMKLPPITPENWMNRKTDSY